MDMYRKIEAAVLALFFIAVAVIVFYMTVMVLYQFGLVARHFLYGLFL